MRVLTDNEICTVTRNASAGLLQKWAWIAEILSAAVVQGDNEVTFRLERSYLLKTFERIKAVCADAVVVDPGKFVLAKGNDSNFLSLKLNEPRFFRFFFRKTAADILDIVISISLSRRSASVSRKASLP